METNEKNVFHLCMWLPAGKDIFGSADPLNEAGLPTAPEPIKNSYEGKINQRFYSIIPELKQDEDYAIKFYSTNGNTISNQELGCRVLYAPFVYTHQPAGFEYNGILKIYSNGLYLWSFFNIPASFQVVDFIEKFYAKSLKFLLLKHGSGQNGGILNQNQNELLLDGLLNENVDPLVFFKSTQDSTGDMKMMERARAKAIGKLITNCLLYVWKGRCKAFAGGEIDYSLGISDEKSNDLSLELNTINSLGDFQKPLKEVSDNQQKERIYFISRISFSALEHFTRIAIQMGLLSYREGSECVERVLVSETLMAKLNKSIFQEEKPSLIGEHIKFSPTAIQGYYSLISAKLPLLVTMRELIEDLSEVNKKGPTILEDWKNDEDKKDLYKKLEECSMSFDSAWGQFDRYLKVLEYDLKSIAASIQEKRDEQNIYELTEIRKGQDYSLEADFEDIKQSSQKMVKEGGVRASSVVGWIFIVLAIQKFSVVCTASVLEGIGGILIFIAIGFIAFYNKKLHPHIWGHYLLSLFRKSKDTTQNVSEVGAQYSKHILEALFTDTKDKLKDERIDSIVNKWSKEMKTPDSEAKLSCDFFKQSIVRGDIASEQKYFLKSAPMNNLDYYYIGLEINEFKDKLFLSSIRIVYFKVGKDKIDINNVIKRLVGNYLRDLFDQAVAEKIIKERGLWTD